MKFSAPSHAGISEVTEYYIRQTGSLLSTRSFAYGNEPSGFINEWEFLDQLSD